MKFINIKELLGIEEISKQNTLFIKFNGNWFFRGEAKVGKYFGAKIEKSTIGTKTMILELILFRIFKTVLIFNVVIIPPFFIVKSDSAIFFKIDLAFFIFVLAKIVIEFFLILFFYRRYVDFFKIRLSRW